MILAQAIPLVVCYMSLGVWDWSLKMVCATYVMWLTPLTLFWEGGKPSPICPLFDLAVIYCLQISYQASLCLIWPWWQCSIHKWFKKAEMRGDGEQRDGYNSCGQEKCKKWDVSVY